MVRRGRRAGHVGKGCPGTWEISFSPLCRGGTGVALEKVQVLGGGPEPGRRTGARQWYRGSKATKRSGKEGEESEFTDSTDETGEPTPGDPGEGSGGPGYGAF